jgi:hypothetical protein
LEYETHFFFLFLDLLLRFTLLYDPLRNFLNTLSRARLILQQVALQCSNRDLILDNIGGEFLCKLLKLLLFQQRNRRDSFPFLRFLGGAIGRWFGSLSGSIGGRRAAREEAFEDALSLPTSCILEVYPDVHTPRP